MRAVGRWFVFALVIKEFSMEDALPDTIAGRLVSFMNFCNQLKLEFRHCWFVGGRRESVADHSWQLALLAVVVLPRISISVSFEYQFSLDPSAKGFKSSSVQEVIRTRPNNI